MKTIKTILILGLFVFKAAAQELQIDNESGVYQTTVILNIDSVNKETLYSKTKEWIALYYKSANDVIQHDDKEDYRIIVKGSFPTDRFLTRGWIAHTIVFDFKDNKIRSTYSNFSYNSASAGTMVFERPLSSKKSIIAETEDNIKASLENLKKHIINRSLKKDDW